MVEGIIVGSLEVFTDNEDNPNYSKSYRGSDFRGNAIFPTEPVDINVNGTPALRAVAGAAVYIANNYYYQFSKDTLIGEAIILTPSLGVEESTVSQVDVILVPSALSEAIVSHTTTEGIGDIHPGDGSIELSFKVDNNAGQDAKLDVLTYIDDVEYKSHLDFNVPKNNIKTNFFFNINIDVTIPQGSVISSKVEMDKDGTVFAPIELKVRRYT